MKPVLSHSVHIHLLLLYHTPWRYYEVCIYNSPYSCDRLLPL